MVNINLSADQEQQLAKVAKKSGKSKIAMAKEALLTFIEDKQDYYAAVRASREHKRSGVTYTLDELKERHGL